MRKVLPPQPPNLLEALVSRPLVGRDLEDAILHVDEADALKDLLEYRPQHGRALHDLGGVAHLVEPRAHRAGWVQRAVVATEDTLDLLRLEPAAGFQGFKGLLGHFCLKVAPAAGRQAGVYVAELVREVPFIRPASEKEREG